MFQSNAAKEVLYIFLWLIGIIFVYALVHTFLLEPSKNNATSSHATHAVSNTSTEHSKIPQKDKVVSKPKIEKVLDIAKVAQPVHKSIPSTRKEALPKANEQKMSEQVTTSSLHTKVPSEIAIPTVVSIPSVPSTPSVPTVPSLQSEKKISVPKVEKIVQKTQKAEEVPASEISRDEQMKLLDTARKHVRELAEASRQKAMSALNQ